VTEWGRRRVRRRSQSLVPSGAVVEHAICAQSSGFGAYFIRYFLVSTALTWLVLLVVVPHLTAFGGRETPSSGPAGRWWPSSRRCWLRACSTGIGSWR
jgi:hypothetical protein